MTHAQAAEELHEAGYEPLEEYPGRVLDSWKIRCCTCGNRYSGSINRLRSGWRCAHRSGVAGNRSTTGEAAAEELKEAGFEPLAPFPGISKLWAMRCLTCRNECRPSLFLVRGGKACRYCERARQSEQELREAGYEPLEPYPGDGHKPWRSRCMTCGQVRRPNLVTIRSGRRCLHGLSWTKANIKLSGG